MNDRSLNRLLKLADKACLNLHKKTGQTWSINPAMAVELTTVVVEECASLLEKEAKSGHDEGTDTYDLLLQQASWMKLYFGIKNERTN